MGTPYCQGKRIARGEPSAVGRVSCRQALSRDLREGIETMPKNPPTLPVRTRVPLAGWAVAAVVTLYSLISSLVFATPPSDHAMPRAEQPVQPNLLKLWLNWVMEPP